MKNKFLGSLALVSMALGGGAQAADFNIFGHLGALYNQGLGNGNIANLDTKKAGYAGFTGHLGLDLGFNALHMGVGVYGSAPIWGTSTVWGNQADNAYSKNYIDVSDLYLKYDTEELKVAVGRFNNDFLESDWLTSYQQGVAAKFDVKGLGLWASWMNDYTTYGYAPGRIASELSSWHLFPSSAHGFQFNKEVFAVGANIDLKFLKIDPFIHYFSNYNYKHDMLQAGTKVALVLGEDSPVQSTTAFRFMWQNQIDIDNDSTMLFWGDQELLFGGFLKLGGGYYATTGGSGIYSINNATRFYGANFFTPAQGYPSLSYFSHDYSVWYVFTGIKSQWFDLDVLYADGTYNEFSAVASVTIFDVQAKGSLNGVALKVGGGYVSNGFNKGLQTQNAIAFVKLSY